METRVLLPEGEVSLTISEVVKALKKTGLSVRHDKQNWGDWLVISGAKTVVSIESQNGLTSSAVIEAEEGEDEVEAKVKEGFRALGWEGEDEDGRYPL